MKKKSAIIKFRNESTKFKIISVKSFYRIEFEFDDIEENPIPNDSNQISRNNIDAIEQNDSDQINHEKEKSPDHRNASNDAFRIERCISHRIIRLAIDQTRSRQVKKVLHAYQSHH